MSKSRKSPVIHPVRPHTRKVNGREVKVSFHYAGSRKDREEIKRQSAPGYLTPKDEEKTTVIFRKYPDGEIIALFPEDKENNGMIGSYMHIGQHGGADYIGVVQTTKLAKPSEYADLKEELESIGYNLDVKQRRQW